MASELTPYQKDILIKTALGEARGQGVEGMADVIQTIFNRASSGKYPSDPAKVALQNKQYSAWNSGDGGNNPNQFSPNSAIYKTAAQALEEVMGGRPDPTRGALFYHTPDTTPYWSNSVNKNGTIERNGHVFYPSQPASPTAPTPASQSPLMASSRSNTSPSGGNTALQNSLAAYATREGNRVTPATMQGRATTVAIYPTTTSLTTPGAINASVNSTRQQPALAAALAARSGIGQAPATRTVQTTRVGNSANNIAAQRDEQAKTRQATPVATRVPLTIGAQSSFAGQDRAPSNLSQARLGASAPGLPALYGTMSQNQVNTIGVPLSNQVSPVNGLRVASTAPTPLARPGVFGAAQPAIAARQQAPIMAAARAPVPMVRPPIAAPVANMPLMAQRAPVQAPLNILVQGSNTIQPRPMSAVQTLQAQGLSPSQAYAAANAGNTPQSVYDRVRGERDSGGSGGVQPKGTIW